jgi:hypothetical protein
MKMKKILMILLMTIVCKTIFGQLNPVNNLSFWQHDNFQVMYNCLSANCFSVYWQKPNISPDTVVGYDVYRNDIIFAFTTDTVVECTGNAPCYHPGFFENIFPCWVTVKAIYNHDSLRSIATDSIYVHDIAIGINELNGQIYFNIYPNPTTENITVETPPLSTIEISNIEGQLIKTLATNGTKTNIDHVGWLSYVVDVSALPCGVYVLQVKTEKGVAVKKFVKE